MPCKQPNDCAYECNCADSGHKYAADFVCKPGNGSFTALRLLNHANHAGKNGIIADAARFVCETAAEIDAAADDLVPGLFIDGNAFAAEHGFIDTCCAVDYFAVNGDALTGANADDLTHNKLINVNLLFASVFCNNTCGVRCKPDELCNGIARPGFCTLFEVFAQHDESDDNAGGFEIQPFMHHMMLSFEYQYG